MTSTTSPRRVVVTGLGAVCPLGSQLDVIWQALSTGTSGVVSSHGHTAPALPYAGLALQFTGEIDAFGELPPEHKKAIRKALKVMCRETQMAVAAAGFALRDANLPEGAYAPERGGVVLGSDYMLTLPEDYADSIRKCQGSEGEFEFGKWGDDGLGQMTPLWMLKYLPNMPASHTAILNDLRGPNNSLTLREAASNMALGEAFRTISRGHADLMLAGATGTRVLPMQAFHALQTEQMASADVAPETACRPFDRHRLGMVAGEGAGVVVMEEYESACRRGAKIYAEVAGLGASSVADRQLRGNCQLALINAAHGALADAGIAAGDLGHVNAHGVATPAMDAAEAAALAEVLAEAVSRVPVFAPKSYFGNLGAGSGAVELITSLLSINHGQLPATLNFSQVDEGVDLAISGENGVPGSTVLTWNVTPQGQAVALVLRCAG